MWQFLASAVGPLAIRALVAIGFGVVSFTGVTQAFTGLVTYATSSWSSLPVSVLQLATLAGIPQALGMVFGAMLARVSLWAFANGSRLMFRGGAQ